MEQEQQRPLTVRERIDLLAQMCIDVYDELRKEEFFREEAAGYASFDLRMEGYVISEALDKFDRYVEENEKRDVDKKDIGG
jgi:hypothetical protein